LDDARVMLNDDAKTRYPDAELMRYLQRGAQDPRRAAPDLFIVTGPVTCTAGQVEQALPVAGSALFDVLGIQNGNAVNRTTLDALRAWRPSWRIDAAAAATDWVMPPQDPSKAKGPDFFVYPKAPANQVVIAMYVPPPADVDVLARRRHQDFPVPDTYSEPLSFYVTGRAEMKDDEHVDSGARANPDGQPSPPWSAPSAPAKERDAVKALDLWLPYVTLETYTAPALIMRQAVLDTAIDFCERTKCWQDNQLYDVATKLDYEYQSTSQWIVHEARSGNLPDRSAVTYKSPLWLDENYPGWRVGADPAAPRTSRRCSPTASISCPPPRKRTCCRCWWR
jgi:hypothetical protein